MIVHVSNRQKTFKIIKPLIKKIAAEVIRFEGQKCDEVSIHFVSAKEIGELHDQFFDDPSETDCISLPIDDQTESHYRILGDVFVCPEVAVRYAKTHKKSVDDEVILYMIHGLLHLMGYDDIEAKERKSMRSAEKRHMAHLKLL
ncbi:MAG TPA: rRNA maturation RNase YbeY [Parachlamydiaceae bacterium]|nr:rRNA maturation RNase YbeY [Parachlamydiaceae bacterium]